jgi:hypothetical protein
MVVLDFDHMVEVEKVGKKDVEKVDKEQNNPLASLILDNYYHLIFAYPHHNSFSIQEWLLH